MNLAKGNILLLVFFAAALAVSCGNSKKIAPPPKSSIVPFKEAFHEANSEKLIGHFESAIALFNKCIVLKPESAASYFGLAQIYYEQKNINKAIDYGKNALNIDNTNKWYVAFLADIYFEMGDYHNSANYYAALIDKHGDQNIDNQSKLAQSYIYSNQSEKAIKTLDRIELEMGSIPMTALTKHDLYNELGKPKLAKESLQKLFDDNATSVEIALEAMDYFLQTRQYDNAAIAIKQAQKIEPNNAYAKLGEAEITLADKNVDKTFELLTQALPSPDIEEDRKIMILDFLVGMSFDDRYTEARAINKKMKALMQYIYPSNASSAKFLSLYGHFLLQNNNDSAAVYFQEAVDIDPNDYSAWINLMNAHYESENYTKLAEATDKALVLYPNQPTVYLLKGMCEYELDNYSKAEEMFYMGKQLVIEDEELLSEFSYHIAKNEWKNNKKEKAAAMFQKAFENDPTNARFYYGYAKLLKEDGSDDKAFQYAKKAAELGQETGKYAAFYADLLIEQENYELAKKMMEKALIKELHNASYLEKYGDILYFLNDIDKAVDFWQQTFEMKPSPRLQQKINTKSYND